MCGGGGTQTTQTYDPEFNRVLAEIAKENQQMAGELYNVFKYGVDYNPQETVRGAYINGKWVDEKDLPKVVAKEGTPGRWDTTYNRQPGVVQGENAPNVPGYQERRWIPGTDPEYGIDPNIKIETKTLGEIRGYDPNAQTSEMQYLQNVVEANQELLGPRTELEKSQLQAAQNILPLQEEYASTLLKDQTSAINQRAPLRTKLYNLAGEDDTNRMVSQAQADVQHSYDNTQKQFERRMFLAGISPNSSSYVSALNSRNLDKARMIAGARTLARDKAKDKQFNRLRTALTTV